ncbi:precorrin-6y C5,15-methyltransferase (decarboxylating) subunit CbiE [bacterium]|nr:precorrin-6y C5,15-methyltransferase (decarboxylating) subunit CbiE [bacterium]
MQKVSIVGVGDDGFSSMTDAARERLAQAELIIGQPRLLQLIGPQSASTVAIGADLAQLEKQLASEAGRRRTVLLASGDPLFYGVARFLLERLGKENFEIVPHVSSMQLAFARVMESWDEAYLSNVANHPAEEIIDRIRTSERVGLFTTESYPPPAVARDLLREGINYFRCYVCENLGARNEVITQGSLSEIAEMDFGPLNVMILVRLANIPDRPRADIEHKLFGNPDEAFRQSRPKRGLITPMEIRTLALAQLSIKENSIVWDIGAGSGSVSIEAARLAPRGKVFAIEPDQEDCQLLEDNARLFSVPNVEVICGRAPEAFSSLPDPDCIFVGGLGRETVGIAEVSFGRLKPGGHFVANLATLEKTTALTSFLRRYSSNVGLLLLNISRGTYQLDSIRLEAVNPSFLIYITKPT